MSRTETKNNELENNEEIIITKNQKKVHGWIIL